MKKFMILLVAVLILGIATPSVASAAHYWHNYGGFPLVHGGAKSATRAINLELNNAHVRRATRKVIAANHQPSWIMAAIDRELTAGDVHKRRLRRGTKVGAMSYGHPREYVMPNTIWHGKNYWLYSWTADVTKTTIVQDKEKTYRKTVTYRWYMATGCANVFVRYIGTKKVDITPPPPTPCPSYTISVVKRLDSASGPMLGGVTIAGNISSPVGPIEVTATTRSDHAVVIATVPSGTDYDLSEVLQAGFEVVTPTNGRHVGTVTDHNVVLTYVNRRVTPPPAHELVVNGSGEFSCLDPVKVSGDLIATVVTHSDADALSYTWTVNGVNYVTTNTRFGMDFAYETWYNITLATKDAAGHTSTSVLAPRYFSAPADPPPPPN